MTERIVILTDECIEKLCDAFVDKILSETRIGYIIQDQAEQIIKRKAKEEKSRNREKRVTKLYSKPSGILPEENPFRTVSKMNIPLHLRGKR